MHYIRFISLLKQCNPNGSKFDMQFKYITLRPKYCFDCTMSPLVPPPLPPPPPPRRCQTCRLYGTTSSRRTTIAESAGRRVTSCFCWCSALGSSCASSGTRATSKPMYRHMRCCKLWCYAVKRPFRSLNKVQHQILLYWMLNVFTAK